MVVLGFFIKNSNIESFGLGPRPPISSYSMHAYLRPRRRVRPSDSSFLGMRGAVPVVHGVACPFLSSRPTALTLQGSSTFGLCGWSPFWADWAGAISLPRS